MNFFSLCFGVMIIMLAIWVDVGTAQTTITATEMPDEKLRTRVLQQLQTDGIVVGTAFTDVDMAHSDFKILSVAGDNIGNLTGLGYATNLTQLTLSNNSISDISAVSGLTSLTQLYLDKNNISDISAVSGLTNLQFLRLHRNDISDIPDLSKLTSLTSLTLDDNSISDISELSKLTSLKISLSLNNNNISDISAVKGLTLLTSLDLTGNKVSDISAVSGLTNLRTLNLAHNEIRYISVLSNLIKLKNLDLSHNEIRDFSVLSKLMTLGTLYLDGSKIRTTDPLLPLTNLITLFIRDHRITDVGELLKLARLRPQTGKLQDLRFDDARFDLTKLDDPDALRKFLYVRPDSIDADRAVAFEDYPENPPTETLPVTIRFDEPVYGFQMEDIIVETKLDTGTGTAILEALTPTTEPAQTYIATIRLPANAAGTVKLIVRAGAAETEDRRIDPAEDRVFGPIAFSTIPAPETPRKRKIILECPVGWVRSDGFAGRTRRVLIYEVKLEMDLHNRVSIYKPDWVAIYVHPGEDLENLEGWKLQVALPYNYHREYLLTAENSVVVDAKIEGVEGGFAFIKDPEEAPFPMTGIGFATSPAPGFDYRLYDDTGRKVDFGISCYKRFDIFQVLKEMEDPLVLRQVLLESFDWDQWFLRSEWTVPIPVNVPGAPSLQRVNLVGKWADLKKQ